MRISIANHNEAKNPKGFINYEIEFEDIAEKVKSGFCYSACKFKDNYRKDDNYLGCEDVLILDIDDICTIEQAKIIFKNYKFWIITSRNHQKLKNDKVCDRFRIFFLLEEPLNDVDIREFFINNIMERYPFVDTSCRNRSRFYYSSPKDAISIFNDGSIFKVIPLKFERNKPQPKEIKSINFDDIYILEEMTGIWINSFGETLEIETYENDSIEPKLKGARTLLDNEFYKGNRNNAIFKAVSMLLNDGLETDLILDFITIENDARGGIKFNELMAVYRSALKTTGLN